MSNPSSLFFTPSNSPLFSNNNNVVGEPDSEVSTGSPPIPLEVLIVDQENVRELLCCICLQILTNPRQCKNGHLFCQVCIMQYVQKRPECPQCREFLNESNMARSLFLEKQLTKMKVYCKYHVCRDEETKDNFIVDKNGCNKIFPLDEVSKHERDCEYAPVFCKFSSRCGKLRRKDINEHQKTCPFRPMECPHCKAHVELSKMEDHLEICRMFLIQCSKCSKEIQRSDIDFHVRNECLEELIPCQFADQGCEAKVLRKNLKEHLGEDVGAHLGMIKLAFDQQMEHFRQKFDSQLKNHEDKIKSLERVISDHNETKIEWRIKNWSNVRKKNYIQSEKFEFAGFTWFIGFYTDGDNEESRGYISVYLFLDVGCAPRGKNVTIEFALKFCNYKDSNESIRKEFKTTFPIKGGQGWGDRKAVKSNRINEESGFLKQDSLFIEAQIVLKKVLWVLH